MANIVVGILKSFYRDNLNAWEINYAILNGRGIHIVLPIHVFVKINQNGTAFKKASVSSVHWASNSLIISTVICMCNPRRIQVQQILCVMPWAWNIHTGRRPSPFQNPTHTFWMFDRSTCNIVLFDLSADIGNPRCCCLDNSLPTPLPINCWTTIIVPRTAVEDGSSCRRWHQKLRFLCAFWLLWGSCQVIPCLWEKVSRKI